MAHYEPPHQDLRCLQIQLFLSQVVIELSARDKTNANSVDRAEAAHDEPPHLDLHCLSSGL